MNWLVSVLWRHPHYLCYFEIPEIIHLFISYFLKQDIVRLIDYNVTEAFNGLKEKQSRRGFFFYY